MHTAHGNLIIASFNVAKGLHAKAAAIESMLLRCKIDIIGLTESDLNANIGPSYFKGYSSIVHSNKKGFKRVVAYVRNTIHFKQAEYDKNEVPHVIIKLSQQNILIIRNEFLYHDHDHDE